MPYCPTCKTEKDISEFYKTKARKSGIHGQCKACEKIYYASVKEVRNKYIQERRAANNGAIRKRDTLAGLKRNKIYKKEFFSIPATSMREVIYYNSETGEFTNKDTGNILKPIKTTHGYHNVYIPQYKIQYAASKLAMFLTYGKWFEYVDHVNGDRTDNRLVNLRECNCRENDCNRNYHRDGKLVGTWHRPDNDTWIARLRIDGRLTRIGPYFATEREASLYYCRYVLKHRLVRREFLPETFTDEELYGEEKFNA